MLCFYLFRYFPTVVERLWKLVWSGVRNENEATPIALHVPRFFRTIKLTVLQITTTCSDMYPYAIPIKSSRDAGKAAAVPLCAS